MDQFSEPLGRRLRDAAIGRTHPESERVDDFVLDADGVIDLRELDREHGGISIAAPAAILKTIKGQLGNAGEISDLYADPEPEKPRWRLGLRARHAFGVGDAKPTSDEVGGDPSDREETDSGASGDDESSRSTSRSTSPISRLSMVPMSAGAAHQVTTEEPERRTGFFSGPRTPTPAPTEIDLRNEARPTSECPKCLHTGHRDLFDRFSQVEYYSCDSCSHMWQLDRS